MMRARLRAMLPDDRKTERFDRAAPTAQRTASQRTG
jgi:hypothetical protein